MVALIEQKKPPKNPIIPTATARAILDTVHKSIACS